MKMSLKKLTLAYRYQLKETALSNSGGDGIVAAYRDTIKDYYIKSKLLFEELCHAKKKENICIKQAETLILIVGHSIEPLLQTCLVYKPKKVWLLLSEKYGHNINATVMYNIVREMIEEIWKEKNYSKKFELGTLPELFSITLKNGAPKTIFQELQTIFQKLHNNNDVNMLSQTETYPLVIDITGGKKSMISGSFLFGAYTNTTISYVDFDEDAYDMYEGKPWGWQCIIKPIEDNPYESYQLNQWPQLEILYKKESYEACCELISKMKSALKKFESEDKRLEKMEKYLQICRLWNQNNYTTAWQEYENPKNFLENFKLPYAIEALGSAENIWPQINATEINEIIDEFFNFESGGFYQKLDYIKVYVMDEYGRISRLFEKHKVETEQNRETGEDYRFLLVRISCLLEFMLRALVLYLAYSTNYCEVSVKQGESDFRLDSKREDSRKQFAKIALSIDHLKQFLFKKENDEGEKIIPIDRAGENSITLKMNQSFEESKKSSWENLGETINGNLSPVLRIRNKTVHSCLPIDFEKVTQAYNRAKDIYEKFQVVIKELGYKEEIPTVDFEAIPWEELCRLCNITVLRKIEKEVGGTNV